MPLEAKLKPQVTRFTVSICQGFTECLREELMLAALRCGSHNKGSPQHRHFYIEIDLLEPILIKYVRLHFLGDIFLGYPELEIQDTVRQ